LIYRYKHIHDTYLQMKFREDRYLRW